MILLTLLALFAYPFVIYPPVLAMLARMFAHKRNLGTMQSEPVALVICALNEQNVIRQKIENSLALDYPKEQLEIVVISDGSSDKTAEIVREYLAAGIRLIDQPARRGKVKNLTEVVPTLKQNIVVFSDANVMYDPLAIKNLVRRFEDASVGCVSGKVVLTETTGPLNAGTDDYYSVEWGLQENASRWYSMVGADGAMYALRRELFQAPPADTIIEDFVIPMGVIRQGWRVVFEPSAVAWEKGAASLQEEFRRKTRIAAGAVQGLIRGNAWPGAVSARAWFVFLSHKFLRWISPILGIVALGIALFSLDRWISKLVVLGFVLLSGAAALRLLLRQTHRALDAPFYFLFGQIAAGIGLIKGITGTQSVLWAKGGPVIMRIVYHHRTRSTDAQRIHILEMANAFAELGHDVEIVSLVPTETEKDNAARDAGDAAWQTVVRKIPFAYELVQLGYNLIGIPLLAAKLMAKRTDFLYERYSLFNFTGVLMARLFRKPIALEVNSPFALEQQRDKQIRAFWLASWTERTICNMATKVIVVSTPLRDIMIQQGIKPEKLVVMPNGVRTEVFKAGIASPELKAKLGIQDRTVIGFVGWFRKWHGLEMLVDAFQKTNLAARDAALLLIGDGPAMEDLRRTVEQHGLAKEVVFTGPVPHADVPQYLDLVDIAVQPAANEYCCPMKIFEYMALGKAIVAPKQANILDVLKENEASFFTPGNGEDLGAAMEKLVADAGLRRRLGDASAKALEERSYSWTMNARRVIEVLLPNLSVTGDCPTAAM